MSCHLCSRGPSSRLQFNCPTCARNHLYPLRYEHVQVLLDKEANGREINDAVTNKDSKDAAARVDNETSGSPLQPRDVSSRIVIQEAKTQRSQSEARTQEISNHIDILKQEIKAGKDEIAKRRAILSQRRSDAESANYQLAERRAASLAAIQSDTKSLETSWDNIHSKIATSRALLCDAAVSVYRLRQKMRRKNGQMTRTFSIGGIRILDLRDLNSASPAHVTTVFSHIAHLLILISHYLALRLPAEITLPHKNYPLPTIFPPAASYVRHDTHFPGSSPSQSSSNSPTASRTDTRPLPRPRPLFVTRSLPKLAKEDPAAYALFLEGATLLAWDVAWVCRTQGVGVGSDSSEDVCDIGRNLWQLLASPLLQQLAPGKAIPARDVDNKQALKNGLKPTAARPNPTPQFGQYSHGTAHSFLAGAEGTAFMKQSKLPSPLKVMDKVKSMLLGEIANAEWELVDEKEWEEEFITSQQQQSESQSQSQSQQQQQEEEVVLEASKITVVNAAVGETGATLPEDIGDEVQSHRVESNVHKRTEGTKGWMKLRSR